MNEDLARKLFQQSDFTAMQADTLAQVLGEMATKEDLHSKIDSLETRLRAEIVRATSDLRVELTKAIAETRADMTEVVANTRAELKEALANNKSDLKEAIAENRTELKDAINDAKTQTMRWGIAMIIAMSSIFTLLDIFID